jgi:hypothetical protein
MYRQLPWELVTDPLGFIVHTLGNTGLTTSLEACLLYSQPHILLGTMNFQELDPSNQVTALWMFKIKHNFPKK